MNIWTVTTVGIHEKDRVETRTWGYYLTREEAIEDMHRCVDTEAGYYTHAIIEEFAPGIYAHVLDDRWFEWSDAMSGWKRCAKLESEAHIINYGMG